MKILDPGHMYLLDRLDSYEKTTLVFVKRTGEMYPGNKSSYEGTNMQEVIRALIDRCHYVDAQIHSGDTLEVIGFLRKALYFLEKRAAKRHNRPNPIVDMPSYSGIELMPTCKKCRHIGCKGECHE